MGIKNKLVSKARQLLPEKSMKVLEETYRKNRVKLVSLSYGFPAKHLRIIAITGTNGKTTTACFINEILKKAGYKTALFSTAIIEIDNQKHINDLNATVGTVGQMQKFFKLAKQAKVDFVILEATSHALSQHKLDGVPIELAIMTNLTQDHLDYHKTMENYAAAKGKLFAIKPRYIVLNRDDSWFDFFNQYPAGEQKITYGTDEKSDARIEDVKLYRNGSEAKMVIDHQIKLNVTSSMPGKYNVYNMAAAVAATYLLGLKMSDIVNGVANLKGVPGRFERVVDGLNYDIIVDYAHTPDAFEKVLAAARSFTKNRLMIVFGATGDRDKTKRPIMGKIASDLTDRIFLTDEESYNEDPNEIREMIYSGIKRAKGEAKTAIIPDRRKAIKKAISIAVPGDTIIVTGMGHEKYRIINGKRIPWNDGDVIKNLLREKNIIK